MFLALLTAFLVLFTASNLQAQGCGCSNCPQFMRDNFVGDFNISVQGATNNTLGSGGQGVCGVNMNFDHEYLGDLSIVLTSPSGQSVTLVGPIGFFGPTDGTEWDVSFVPCGNPVSPDGAFNSTWQNNQPWGLNNTYSGTYYPASGCLQNFNSGSVNGTWSLTVTDGQAVDVGNFYDYEIIFCDPSGINCFSCVADAGNIQALNVTGCEGAANLNLNLPPTYNPPNSVAPPAGDYDYTYVIGGPGGIIQGYAPSPDLSTYPPGNYTVCGLSYFSAQVGDLPAPGSMTVNQLNTLISSGQSSFCADITANCANVTINPGPQDIEVTETICAPACFAFSGQSYCSSGTYTRTLFQNGCSYTATLNLTVVSVPPTNLTQTICEGECSGLFGFESACFSGAYELTLPNYLGCDSVINLNLLVTNVEADIAFPGELTCTQLQLNLNGISTTTGNVTYTWAASNGGNIIGPSNTLNTIVNTAGDYALTVCLNTPMMTCCTTAVISVTERYDPPAAPNQITGSQTVCIGQNAIFNVTGVGSGGTYNWTVPPGVTINSGQGTTSLNVTWNTLTGGNLCATYNNSCGTSNPVCIPINVVQPIVPTQPTGPATACAGITTQYQTTANPGITNYIWTVTAPATIISGQGTNVINVNWGNNPAGSVCVRAVSLCGTSQPVCLPVAVSSPPAVATITGNNTACTGNNAAYSVTAVTGATYGWQVTGGTIASGSGTTSISVNWNANATTGSVCVIVSNACGNNGPACLNVTLSALPVQPLITGNNATCAGTTGIYSIAPLANATGYTWSISSGGTLVSGQNTTQVNVNWLTAPGGNVCVLATGTCGPGPQFCFPVAVSTQPVSNAGNGGTVCGSSFNLQATPSVAGSSGLWILVPGAPGPVTFGNPNNAATSVTVTQSGTYRFVWEEQLNTCTSGDSVSVIFSNIPIAGPITRNCDGANQNFTVSFPITNGTPPYTVPGGSVVNGVFTSNPIPSGNNYAFQVTDARGCQSTVLDGSFNCNCSTNAGTMALQMLAVCQGSSSTATHVGGEVLDANDGTAYVLHTGSATTLGTIFGQNATGTFSFQTGMAYETTYYVSFIAGNNLNGNPDPNDPCFSVAQGQPVVWHQTPAANAGVDADTCGLTLPLAGNTNVGTGTWSVVSSPAGGTLSLGSAQSPATIATASGFGAYQLAWTIDNMGCTAADTVQLTFNGAPVPGTAVPNCDANNQNYTISILLSGGTPPYSVGGTTVASTTFTSAPIASGSPYSLTISDANGCTATTVTGSLVCNCTTQAGTMDLAALAACEGDSLTATHLGGENLDGNDVTAYILHTGDATTLGTVFAQNATGTFGFQNGMTYDSTYYVSFVVGNNLNGQPDPTDPCLAVASGQPVVWHQFPVVNAGVDADTCGSTLTLNGNTGVGQWTVGTAPSGATLLFADDQDPKSAVTASATGPYSLIWTVTANGCVRTDEVDINFNASPSLVDLVRTCDAANENFTVTLTLTGGTSPYTVNNSPVTDSIFVSAPFTNGATYSFAISDANSCVAPPVNGAYSCNCSTNAGTMAAVTLTVCEGQSITVTANNDQLLDANDVTAYVLHDGSGPALGNILDQNTTGVFSFQSGMIFGKTYYVSLIAGNPLNGQPNPLDPCFSVAIGQPVVWLQNPTPNAGPDTAVCGSTLTLQAASGSFGGIWTQVSGPDSTSFSNATLSSSVATVPGSGTYVFRWTETNGVCPVFDEVTINFNALPTVDALDETCDGTNTQFTVTFTVAGGTAPYIVNGLTGTFSSSNFTSAALNNNGIYTFNVVDANGCASADISGSKNCNCATDAGSVVTTPATFCADQSAVATWNNDATLDANDLVQFILHSTSGTTVGTIYATAAQPSFAFTSDLQAGVVYYISAIAGNNASGAVDLTDDCLSVTPGTPVQWKLLPTATLSGDTTICAGSSTSLSFSGTGTFPLQINYTFHNGATSMISVGNAQAAVLQLAPDTTITYTLTSVVDGTLPACSVSLTATATIVVNSRVEAGTAAAALAFCRGISQTVLLAQQLTNADAGGVWTETSAVPSTGGAFNAAAATFSTAAQVPGTYTFRYRIDAAEPCADEEATVTIQINTTPTADAGTDKTLDCNTSSAILGGPNTTAGPGISYQWTLDTAVVGVVRTLTTSQAGAYTLVVTSAAGCSATDKTVVILDAELPSATLIANPVRCFGEKNGSIRIDSIVSSHPPVLFSLNGGTFSSSTTFAPLPPGQYTVVLQDANGCESTSAVLTVAEPAQLVANLGPDLELSLGDSAVVALQLSDSLSILDTIIWRPLLDSSAIGRPYQRWLPTESSPLNVRVVDHHGCVAEDRLIIALDKRRHIYIPNIIAPGATGNDFVTVFGGKDVAEIEMFQIFDRWGENLYELLHFQPNNVADGWGGKFRDKEVASGVYVYYAVVRFKDGEREVYSGDVTVLR